MNPHPLPNWREPQKNRRQHKPDPEKTRSGLLARIALLEHQKKVLMARVEELEEAAEDITKEYPAIDVNLKTGRYFYFDGGTSF